MSFHILHFQTVRDVHFSGLLCGNLPPLAMLLFIAVVAILAGMTRFLG